MKIESAMVKQLTISDIPGLDPLRVTVDNLGGTPDKPSGKGRITIECFGQAWSAYWGGMSACSIEQFFLDGDEHYLAKNLNRAVFNLEIDDEGLKQKALTSILKLRRGGDLAQDEARDLYDEIDLCCLDNEYEIDLHQEAFSRVFGGDWRAAIPHWTGHEYLYVCKIVNAVKAAFEAMKDDAAPAMSNL